MNRETRVFRKHQSRVDTYIPPYSIVHAGQKSGSKSWRFHTAQTNLSRAHTSARQIYRVPLTRRLGTQKPRGSANREDELFTCADSLAPIAAQTLSDSLDSGESIKAHHNTFGTEGPNGNNVAIQHESTSGCAESNISFFRRPGEVHSGYKKDDLRDRLGVGSGSLASRIALPKVGDAVANSFKDIITSSVETPAGALLAPRMPDRLLVRAEESEPDPSMRGDYKMEAGISVTNLEPGTTCADVEVVFQQLGEVLYVRDCSLALQDQSLSCAMEVFFSESVDAENAVRKMNGAFADNRYIRVSLLDKD